ncbi:MAG: preprotein translocase, SecG subunit [Francisellaceae bacterium]|nr:preprotein translocase, SecG subunit [Francisellaceae bacterium]
MQQLVIVFHVIAAFVLIGLILLQQGKGAEAGASFGGSASQTFFGSQGSGSFLTRLTAIFASIFFITSLSLGFLLSDTEKKPRLDKLLDSPHLMKEQSHKHKTSAENPVIVPLNDDVPDLP